MSAPTRRFASPLLLLLFACTDVAPANQTPVVADTIPDHTLGARTESTIDLSPYFTDPDGDTLSYDAVSHDPATVSVSVEGSLLTMTAGHMLGASEIEVRAFTRLRSGSADVSGHRVLDVMAGGF